MSQPQLSSGVVHKVPADIREAILATKSIQVLWEDITPLARNEWICWVESAKKAETRTKRISVMLDKFKKGMRRPCCWEGCSHR